MKTCIVLLLEIGILAQSYPASAAGAASVTNPPAPASAKLADSSAIPQESSTPIANQGCVNQGSDRREFAPVVCWLQRRLSWKSKHKPHFALIGKSNATNLGLAWPPYAVFNLSEGHGNWHMFRIGFRYDRTWRGYIFPTIAVKKVAYPLRY